MVGSRVGRIRDKGREKKKVKKQKRGLTRGRRFGILIGQPRERHGLKAARTLKIKQRRKTKGPEDSK